MPLRLRIASLLLLALASPARAEEGFWTFPALPRERIAADLGVVPSDAALDKLKAATLRFGGYCTAALAGPQGLILTNHHCAIDCVKGLSKPGDDTVEKGFLARTPAEEKSCAGLSVERPVSDTGITPQMKAALAGLSGDAYADKLEQAIGEFVGACQLGDDSRSCSVVSLYNGAEFRLQAFRVYRDVRLVFAAENASANFGGDPDNFNFPRYGFDVAMLRLYEDDRPAELTGWLNWRVSAPREGEPVFAAGYPGTTFRHFTMAQLESMRDGYLPWIAIRLSELRGRLLQFASESAERRRIVSAQIYDTENSLKSTRGEYDTLAGAEVMAKKAADEAALRARIAADPALGEQVGAAFEEIAAAEKTYRQTYRESNLTQITDSGGLWGKATGLVRAANERAKPETERLSDYVDANLPAIEQQLLSEDTFEPELDRLRLAFGLSKLREYLGADHPTVVAALGKESPEALAERAIAGTAIADVAARRRLYEGGAAAAAASNDPLIRLAAVLDPLAYALEQRYSREVEAPAQLAHQRIAAARVAGDLAGRYPDADGSLRLSYGRVMGWTAEDGGAVPACTFVEGLARRATGAEPFALAPAWAERLKRLDPKLAFNCVTTHDAVGGNSGSPVADAHGELVGLLFDGNLPSLGGTYLYDGEKNRTIVVTIALVREALSKIYDAPELVPSP